MLQSGRGSPFKWIALALIPVAALVLLIVFSMRPEGPVPEGPDSGSYSSGSGDHRIPELPGMEGTHPGRIVLRLPAR